MNDMEKNREELIKELAELRKKVADLSRNQLTHEDRLKLAIINTAPFAFWAADRSYKIVLWSGLCEQTYGISARDAIDKDYVNLFVDSVEQQQSREDCLRVIDYNVVFKNFLAYDHARDGSRRTMLTNCFRIWDEENQQHLQAEVALEISDLELRKDEHRTLREIGIARLEQEKKVFNLMRRELISRLGRALLIKKDRIEIKARGIEEFRLKIKRKSGEKVADELTKDEIEKLNREKQQVQAEHDRLALRLMESETSENLDKVEADIINYESGTIPV